jgi:Na+/melibiose symporter-like transporter
VGSNPTSTAIHGLRLISGRGPPRGVVVLGPQGTLFLILLLLAFGGLITWVALARQVVFRVIAACLAFIPAMVFGSSPSRW